MLVIIQKKIVAVALRKKNKRQKINIDNKNNRKK